MDKNTVKAKIVALGEDQQKLMKDVMALEKNLEGAKADLNRVNGQITAWGEVLQELKSQEEDPDAEV